MVPFAIGSETAGSIASPAARCGVTALRPTFGAIGRTGVMSLSESLVWTKVFIFRVDFSLFFSFSNKAILYVFDRTSLALSVEALQIVQSF